MASKRRLRGTGAAVCGVAVIALAACGGNRFHYVQNKDDRAFFKVPSAWSILEVKPTKDDTSKMPTPWTRVFDAADDPKLDHVVAEVPTPAAPQWTTSTPSPQTASRRRRCDRPSVASQKIH
jgi:hypothetical protein